MKPIINPLWIYLADVSYSIKIFTIVFGVLFIAIGLVLYFGSEDIYYDDEDVEKGCKTGKYIVVISIILLLLGCLLPTKNTCYSMIAAKIVTTDNVNYTKEQVVDFIDEITDAIKR